MTKESDKKANNSAPATKSNNGDSGQENKSVLVNLIHEIQLPHTLIGSEQGQIGLTFAPDLDYIKIKFSATNPNLRITCGGRLKPDCVFEFSFDKDDDRKRSFEIRAITIENESAEPIEILYTTERDSPPADGELRWITLKPAPKPGGGYLDFLRWLWHINKKWYLRYPIMGIAIVFGLWYFDEPRTKLFTAADYILVWTGVKKPPPPQPESYDGHWTDDFTEEEAKTLTSRWDFKAGQVEIVDGELLIKGRGMVLAKLGESKTVSDFKVTFKFRFVRGTEAAWVIRAQPDKSRGYIFVLRQSGRDLFLEGYKATNLDEKEKIDPLLRRVPIECCQGDDTFLITAVVNGGTIHYDIEVSNPRPRDGVNQPDPHSFDFRDQKNSYPNGSAGFFGLDGSEIKAEYWYLDSTSQRR
ncbi:MAG: hypothetical protein WAQ99_21875 [Pyrinomonadaceae bacterium]